MDQYESDDHEISAQLALGMALRAMHQRSNRTLRTVERDVSISDSTLSRYFRGRAVPSWPTVQKICASFGEDPESVRHLWVAAIAERSSSAFPAANGVPADLDSSDQQAATVDGDDDDPAQADGDADAGAGAVRAPRAVRTPERRSRAVWLSVGLVIGFALGVGLTASATLTASTAPAPTGLRLGAGPVGVSGSAVAASGSAATGRYCPWKYVVTDGTQDDLRIFDDPQRDSLIARYAPSEVFYAAEPPQIVNHMLKTEHGWVSQGDWVQRYTGAACRTGGS